MKLQKAKYSIFLFTVVLLSSCSHHKDYGWFEDEIWDVDTIIKMPSGLSSIDTLNFVSGKKFEHKNWICKDLMECDSTFWLKYIEPIPFINNTKYDDVNFTTDEGTHYFIINKTEVKQLNLVTMGSTSFNGKETDFVYLMLTNKQNQPLLFWRDDYEWVPLNQFELNDSSLCIKLVGDHHHGYFTDSIVTNIKLDYRNRTIHYKKHFQIRNEG